MKIILLANMKQKLIFSFGQKNYPKAIKEYTKLKKYKKIPRQNIFSKQRIF